LKASGILPFGAQDFSPIPQGSSSALPCVTFHDRTASGTSVLVAWLEVRMNWRRKTPRQVNGLAAKVMFPLLPRWEPV
jgi:hypothetical protein